PRPGPVRRSGRGRTLRGRLPVGAALSARARGGAHHQSIARRRSSRGVGSWPARGGGDTAQSDRLQKRPGARARALAPRNTFGGRPRSGAQEHSRGAHTPALTRRGPGPRSGPGPQPRAGVPPKGGPQFSVTNDTGAGRVADREVNQLVSPMTVKAPTTRARMISHGSSMTPTPVIRSRALRIPRIVPLAVTPPSRMPTPVTAVDSVTAMRTTCHLVRPLSRAAANSPRRSLVAMTTALIAAKSAYRLDIPNNTVKICNWAFC